MRFSRSVLVSWVVLAAVSLLAGLEVIDYATQLVATALIVGYALGRLHEAHQGAEEAKAAVVAALGNTVSAIGRALADDEVPEEHVAEAQAYRAQLMELLGVIDRPPLAQRLRERLRS